MKIKFLDGSERNFETLIGADLRNADLCGADLRDANLRNSNLCNANLSGADLRNADLREVNLSRTVLPGNFRIARLDFGGYSVTVTPTHTTIGCQRHENELWLNYQPHHVTDMAFDAGVWWQRHCSAVKAVIRDVTGETS